MKWDLGLWGLAYLLAMSMAFGLVAHVAARRVTSKWIGPLATVAFFVLGLVISEGLFGSATEEELQPNIDGLSRDEVLLGLLPGIAGIVLARRWGVRRHGHRSQWASPTRLSSRWFEASTSALRRRSTLRRDRTGEVHPGDRSGGGGLPTLGS